MKCWKQLLTFDEHEKEKLCSDVSNLNKNSVFSRQKLNPLILYVFSWESEFQIEISMSHVVHKLIFVWKLLLKIVGKFNMVMWFKNPTKYEESKQGILTWKSTRFTNGNYHKSFKE